MKQIFRIFLSLALVLMFCFQAVNACSFDYPLLRREFRKSSNVFYGEVLEVNEVKNSKKLSDEMKREINGQVKFRVIKSWKGKTQKEKTFYANIICSFCGEFDYYKVGEKRLIVAEENYVSRCSDRLNSEAEKEMKRLDKFWFRTWARVYPF